MSDEEVLGSQDSHGHSESSMSPDAILAYERKRADEIGGISADAAHVLQKPENCIEVLQGRQQGTVTYLACGRFLMNRTNLNLSKCTLKCVKKGGVFFFFLFSFVFFFFPFFND